MNIIKYRIQIEKRISFDRDEYRREFEKQCQKIGNGYCVLEGSSLDIINTIPKLNGISIFYDKRLDESLFIIAGMLNCIQQTEESIFNLFRDVEVDYGAVEFCEKCYKYLYVVEELYQKYWKQ